MRAQPDAEYELERARAGDLAALDALLRRHRGGVYRYGLQVCPTTEDAEDAVQITLWAATRAIARFRGGASSVVAWLFAIVRRECWRFLDRRRASPMELALVQGALVDERLAPDDVLEARRGRALLAAGLRALDPQHREVVLLRDVEGLAAPAAAARLGISVPALKSRLHRARAALADAVHARA